MAWFKCQSEKYFETIELEKDVAGLQYQQGTKWRQGLNAQELVDFQNELGFEFPEDLIEFYKTMNGTNLNGVNVCAEQGVPYNYAPIYFSYPEHLSKIKGRIQEILSIKGLTIEQIREKEIPPIFPITDFYFMIFDNLTNPIYFLTPAHNRERNQMCVYGSLWTDTLRNWLIKDVFHRTTHISDLEEFPNKIREANYWTT